MKVFISSIVVLLFASCIYAMKWSTYKRIHNLKFESKVEHAMRRGIFEKNKEFVIQHNAQNEDFKVELNKFSHLTDEEFQKFYLAPEISHKPVADHSLDNEEVSPPVEVDWRKHGVVMPVRNQGQCGSCWAFAITSAIESAVAMKKNESYILSPQQLVDCSLENSGCSGGLESFTYDYLKNHKLEQEKDYPYTAEDGDCKYETTKSVVEVKSYKLIPSLEGALSRSIMRRPTNVRLFAGLKSFRLYKSGVYYDKDCVGTYTNHLVTAVGFIRNSTHNFYIIKNSWGTNWGVNGYLYLARNRKPNCGVASLSTFPIV